MFGSLNTILFAFSYEEGNTGIGTGGGVVSSPPPPSQAPISTLNSTVRPVRIVAIIRLVVLTTTLWTAEKNLITPIFMVERNEIETRFGKYFNVWGKSWPPIVWA